MAARVESERRFSRSWPSGSATDETITKNTAAAIEKDAVLANQKYRYERYATDTAMPLQLPLIATMAKSDASAALRYFPFFKNAYASGIDPAAKNARELGFPTVQKARPASHGRIAVAEKGSSPKTWRTAYGKFVRTKPKTSAMAEFLRKLES